MSPRGLLTVIGGLLLLFAVVENGHAQDRPSSPDTTTVEDPTVTSDTTARGKTTSGAPLNSSDTSATLDSSNESGRGNPKEAVTFSARDSMVIRTLPSGEDHGTLHGEADMLYQGASLEARTIEMDFQNSTLQAEGPPSDSAEEGRALFKRDGTSGDAESSNEDSDSSLDGGEAFTGDVLRYNLNTERGRVVAARTQQEDGYVEGSAVKVFEDSTLFVQDGTYTTCNCPPGETPSYSLRSDEMKVEDRWVYTGPIQLFLFNVPTPLWLPIGFLPNTEGRRSGPLPPEYGEDRRGFFLKDWGWYFAFNQFTDLSIRAGYWSQGSFEIRPRFRYKKRYKYDGDLKLTYRRERIGEEVDPNFQDRTEGQVRWSHNQDFSPTASFNGSVDLFTSTDFSRRNSDDLEDAVRQEASSNVQYDKRWPNGGRQLTLGANQKQKFQSGEVDLTLPNLGFSQNSFKPFQSEERVGDEQWFEKITTSYSLNASNEYAFTPRDPEDLRERGTPTDSSLADSVERADIDWYEALVDRDKYELATGNDRPYTPQAQHRIPLSATFRIDQYNLSLTPSINYNSDWRINTTRKTALRDSTGGLGEVVERNKPGFYARHDFDTSLSANSEVFGTFPIGLGPFQGLRHRLSPTLSLNYQPNFNNPLWGRTRTLRFPDGTPVVRDSSTGEVRRYDILGGGSANNDTQQWRLDLSINNVFETKQLQSDTTGETSKETLTLLNLDVSGLSYNFAADSFRVGDNVNVNARTRIDPLDIRVRSRFSPYALRQTSSDRRRNLRRVDRLMISESPLTPVRLTSFQASVGADFSSDASVTRPERNRSSNSTSSKQNQSSTASLSTMDIPWSLGLNFNYRLQKPRKEITSRTTTISADFRLNVTPLWHVEGNTGYDLREDKVSTTRLNIKRDLGCWEMSFRWVPFGEFQKYGFKLQVKSGHLSDILKLQVPNESGDGRLGGFGDQLQGTNQNTGGSNF